MRPAVPGRQGRYRIARYLLGWDHLAGRRNGVRACHWPPRSSTRSAVARHCPGGRADVRSEEWKVLTAAACVLDDEVDWIEVAASVVRGAAEVPADGAGVTAAEAAGGGDGVVDVDGHVVHEAEHAAARGLRDLKRSRVELPERVRCQPLRVECGLDDADNVRPERAQLRRARARDEDGKERASVREQQALAPLEPEDVRVPVLVAG